MRSERLVASTAEACPIPHQIFATRQDLEVDDLESLTADRPTFDLDPTLPGNATTTAFSGGSVKDLVPWPHPDRLPL
jgi:hypothetical protein